MKLLMNLIKITILLFPILLIAQSKNNVNYYLIPKPNHIKFSKDYFVLNNNTKIICVESTKHLADYLSNEIKLLTNFELNISSNNSIGNNIFLKIENNNNKNDEFYKLSITKNSIYLISKTEKGIFRGIQTILQLIPIKTNDKNIRIPCLEIEDSPQFTWRGLNLDCGRHFMTKEFIKRYIDILAHYKFNKFHWHLTEDQGWRIEIKKYPKLTLIGAWRKEADGSIYGGYYTQNDIKEIVEYAKSRYIDIIPEIEMPGHSVASLASYPENSCTGGPFEVANTWGVFKDVYCAGNDSTFIFLQNILAEVCSLFPYEYIHIGGDEVPKERWKECQKCQNRIKNENLKDEKELQTYFITRIAKYLETKGKKIIGWEEILEGGLTKGATVQSWTGFDGAIKTAKQNHYSICSPASHTYLNAEPDDLNLRTCYSFNPIPSELNDEESKYIIGSEVNLWTEHAPQETVDNKLFPRILALSEVFWLNPNNKDYDDFYLRLQKHYKYLIKRGINYGREGKAVEHQIISDVKEKAFIVKLFPKEKDVILKYSFDSSFNKSYYYKNPITIKNNCKLFYAGFKYNQQITKIFSLPFSFHKALNKKIELLYPYNEKYRADGENSLINGNFGTVEWRNGLGWQGFEGTNLEAIIDMGKREEFSKIGINCLQDVSSWIFFPTSVEFYVSNDKENFIKIGSVNNDYPQKSGETTIKTFSISFNKDSYRYIKVKAIGVKTCPEWHPGAGGKAWIFADEITVE